MMTPNQKKKSNERTRNLFYRSIRSKLPENAPKRLEFFNNMPHPIWIESKKKRSKK